MNKLDEEIARLVAESSIKSVENSVNNAFFLGYFRQAYRELLIKMPDECKEEEIQRLKYLLKSMTP